MKFFLLIVKKKTFFYYFLFCLRIPTPISPLLLYKSLKLFKKIQTSEIKFTPDKSLSIKVKALCLQDLYTKLQIIVGTIYENI